MSNKSKISALTLGVIIASSTPIALAESVNKSAPTIDENTPVNVQAPVMPSVPYSTNSEGNTLKSNDLESNSNVNIDDKMAAPVQTMTENPKADGSIIDKLVSHYNNREVDDILSMFSTEGFIKINADGSVIKDNTSLRKYLVNIFAGDKKRSYTAQVDTIKEVAPNIALIAAQYNSFEDGQATIPMAKLYVMTIIKYENNSWKIISQQASEISKEMVTDTDRNQSNNGIKMMLMGLVGIIVGFFASKFMYRRQYPNQHSGM